MFTAAGKSAAVSAANYIEEVFSTYLYTGNGSTQTITNGIDLFGKGGLVWIKGRGLLSGNNVDNVLFDTARGASKILYSNLTDAEGTTSWSTAFNNNGFSFNTASGYVNSSSLTVGYASWTFRKQAKFFDVVTYTGNGVAGRTVSHNLGSTPGCIIVKRTNNAKEWNVYHRSMTANGHLELDSTAAKITSAQAWNNTEPTSTVFTVGNDLAVNGNGSTYVAYLFAHDAGGFGPAGTDNVISCGSYTGNGSADGPSITLGYEAAWVMTKNVTTTGNWQIQDVMRGMPLTSASNLMANLSDAEDTDTSNPRIFPTATGFKIGTANARVNTSGQTYIYIAIRRGPMKTPTSGTSVFSPIADSSALGTQLTTNFPVDMQIANIRTGFAANGVVPSRLTAVSSNTTSSGSYLRTPSTNAEVTGSDITRYWSNTGFQVASNWAGSGMIYWNFGRAPGFFDVVCYTGTGSATTFNHNLTVVPELMIVKSRNNATNWAVYCAYLGGANPANRYVLLNSSNSFGGTSVYWNDTAPTSTVFTVGTTAATNTSAYTYVNYLFATCPGVSKVGSYTGTGALQTINCGFASGARFVLIKRTDSTGDWWTYDSARGITSGNDPYLFLNSTAAEVTNTNYVDTASTGFQVTAAAPAGLNANGGTYIFLAIA